MKVKRKNIF